MWARKTTRQCIEDDGVHSEEEYVEINQSWDDILWEGLCGLWLSFIMFWVCLIGTPILAIRAAYMARKYSNCPVPQNEVRERAHLG